MRGAQRAESTPQGGQRQGGRDGGGGGGGAQGGAGGGPGRGGGGGGGGGGGALKAAYGTRWVAEAPPTAAAPPAGNPSRSRSGRAANQRRGSVWDSGGKFSRDRAPGGTRGGSRRAEATDAAVEEPTAAARRATGDLARLTIGRVLVDGLARSSGPTGRPGGPCYKCLCRPPPLLPPPADNTLSSARSAVD